MKKKLMALAMAMAFTAASAVVAYSFTCEVTAIDGTKVTMECKEKYAKKLAVGKSAKVSPKKEGKKAYEGC